MSGSWDKTIKLWDVSSGKLIQSLNVNISIGALVMLKKSKIVTKFFFSKKKKLDHVSRFDFSMKIKLYK